VPNAKGVQENPVDVLRDSKPLPGEPLGMVTRYSTLTTKVLTYVIEGATGRSFDRPVREARLVENRDATGLHGRVR